MVLTLSTFAIQKKTEWMPDDNKICISVYSDRISQLLVSSCWCFSLVFGWQNVLLVWSSFIYAAANKQSVNLICGNEMPTRCNRWFLLQILLLAQHYFGHHYAHHQELESIIQVVAACGIWRFGFQSCWCGVELRKPDT